MEFSSLAKISMISAVALSCLVLLEEGKGGTYLHLLLWRWIPISTLDTLLFTAGARRSSFITFCLEGPAAIASLGSSLGLLSNLLFCRSSRRWISDRVVLDTGPREAGVRIDSTMLRILLLNSHGVWRWWIPTLLILSRGIER